jgi:hypothetical protein
MATYTPEQADAFADIKDAGASVTFSRITRGVYNPLTGDNGGTTTTATSVAIARVASRVSDVERVRALDLVNKRTVVLIVAGLALATANFRPLPDDVVAWAGEDFVVRDVSILAPDGVTPILYFVLAAR